MAPPSGTALDDRRAQMFSLLDAGEIARIASFGERRGYRDGSALFRAGEPGPGRFVLLAGQARITRLPRASASIDDHRTTNTTAVRAGISKLPVSPS